VGSGGSRQRGDIIKRRKAAGCCTCFSRAPASLCGVFSINTPEGPKIALRLSTEINGSEMISFLEHEKRNFPDHKNWLRGICHKMKKIKSLLVSSFEII
jgi:hypothetical protein